MYPFPTAAPHGPSAPPVAPSAPPAEPTAPPRAYEETVQSNDDYMTKGSLYPQAYPSPESNSGTYSNYAPSAPPSPPVPLPPPTAPPSKVYVEENLKPDLPKPATTSARTPECSSLFGTFLLGILAGTLISFFSLLFHCCVDSLKKSSIRRVWYNIGCLLGIIANVFLWYYVIRWKIRFVVVRR